MVPASVTYGVELSLGDGVAELFLDGDVAAAAEPLLHSCLGQVVQAGPERLVLRAEDVVSLSEPSARALAFGCERVGLDTDIFLVGASEEVKQTLREVGFLTEVTPVVDVSEIAPLAR